MCWIPGAVSSAFTGIAFAARQLPMQSGLQVFFVGMSFYGWLKWKRAAGQGELPVGVWPLAWHGGVAVALALLSLASARLLASETHAAWPLLDSLTTWFSLFATWLAARAKMENWIYWVVIDAVLAFLCYQQNMYKLALLNVVFIVIAAAGFFAWRRRYRTQMVPA
jgi:nicotinamide mononucleotide transporter